MKEERIREIMEKISRVKIAVCGDFCLDAYWQMDPDGSEVSVETGLQAEAVARHSYSPGGAGNIVANLSALKPAAIKVIGVVGKDIHGRELSTQLQSLGADTSALFIQGTDFNTYTYTKKIYGEKEAPRVDFGVKNRRSTETDEMLLRELESAIGDHDAIIFNQQVSGSISNEEFISKANQLFDRYNDQIVLVDSRHFNERFRNIHRKVNETELARLCGVEADPQQEVSLADVRKYGSEEHEKTGKPVFVTCGSRGIVCVDDDGISAIPGIQLGRKLDTVGAGDTTISALACCLAAGIPPPEAARFANLAAGVTVQKLFTTGTASGAEIMQLNRTADYVYRPELAADPRQATYLPGTEMELCDHDVPARFGKVRHVLFDHDGTISTLRQGWESVMEPVMIRAIMGEQYETADPGLYKEVRQQVLDYIDLSTGIQTILQMEALAGMVEDFNLVPKDRILDPFGYKEIYNEALMEMVSKRLEKLASGELKTGDFTLKGAVPLLKALKEKGMKLYMASGTDRQDVIHEAERLGYAELFDGGIYGSENDIRKYSKKMIIHRIITENDLQGDELVVLGDGPVEIRECLKAGGIAIGVASDEVRRFGLNPAKRTRLIRAGAHMIIPDFSQYRKLMEVIFGQ